jgi:hypothetical protein
VIVWLTRFSSASADHRSNYTNYGDFPLLIDWKGHAREANRGHVIFSAKNLWNRDMGMSVSDATDDGSDWPEEAESGHIRKLFIIAPR